MKNLIVRVGVILASLAGLSESSWAGEWVIATQQGRHGETWTTRYENLGNDTWQILADGLPPATMKAQFVSPGLIRLVGNHPDEWVDLYGYRGHGDSAEVRYHHHGKAPGYGTIWGTWRRD
jgi:hypothetical protein